MAVRGDVAHFDPKLMVGLTHESINFDTVHQYTTVQPGK